MDASACIRLGARKRVTPVNHVHQRPPGSEPRVYRTCAALDLSYSHARAVFRVQIVPFLREPSEVCQTENTGRSHGKVFPGAAPPKPVPDVDGRKAPHGVFDLRRGCHHALHLASRVGGSFDARVAKLVQNMF